MNPLSFISAWKAYLLGGLVLILTGSLMVQTVRLGHARLEMTQLQADVAQERSEAALALSRATAKARQAESDLNTQATQARKETNDQVRSVAVQRDALLVRVRRAEAAARATVPGTGAATGAGQAGSGDPQPELLGSLGEADVREAERADTIRLHLAACYRQYDGAQAALKALSHD